MMRSPRRALEWLLAYPDAAHSSPRERRAVVLLWTTIRTQSGRRPGTTHVHASNGEASITDIFLEGAVIAFRPAFDRSGKDHSEEDSPETKAPAESPESSIPSENVDHALRPARLGDFVGQKQVAANLSIAIQAASLRKEPLDHVLLSGLPGLGKTTLAEILAAEMGVGLRATSGPVIDRPGDLAGLLTGLSPGDILFIDEIHRLPTQVEEYLYSAMEDFKLVIMLDQGPRARSVPISLSPFTLVGATTREGLLSEPFRARFGIHERLEPYPPEHLVTIANRSAGLLSITLSEEASSMLATASRGTPRLINRYLRRIRDLAQVESEGHVSEALAGRALGRLGLDEHGLLPIDRRLLQILLRAGSHAVGLKSLAVALGEEDRTVEDVYEPFLIREGFMAKTSRGRVITERGRVILGHEPTDGGETRPLFTD